jgi:predicted DNA-binding ribbon-helix-helix protein
MESPIGKRAVLITGRKTSVSLEDAFWSAPHEIATSGNRPLCNVMDEIETTRCGANRSAHVRLFVLEFYRAKSDGPSTTISAGVPPDHRLDHT